MTRGRQIGRPLAATLFLLAGLVLGGTLLASALADLAAASAERDAKAAFMSRGLAGRRGAAPAGPGADETLAIQAETETLAAARIDDLLREAAREAGGTVLSSRAEAKEADATTAPEASAAPVPPGRIETAALVEGRIEALQALLYRLETGRPMVLVDEVAIQGAEAANGGDPRAPLLRATMTLSAYWTKPVR